MKWFNLKRCRALFRVFADAVLAMTAALPVYLLFFSPDALGMRDALLISFSWDARVVASRFGFCLGVWLLVFIGLSLDTYASDKVKTNEV